MDLREIVKQLIQKFSYNLTYDEVDKSFAATMEDTDENENNRMEKLDVIRKIRNDEEIINLLCDIASSVRQIREIDSVVSSCDSWNSITEGLGAENFCVNMYAMISVGLCVKEDSNFRKISMLTAQAYVLLLAIPGAQQVDAFNENLIERSLDLLQLFADVEQNEISNNRTPDHQAIEFQVMGVLDAFRLTFSFVSLEKCPTVRLLVIDAVRNLIYYFYEKGLYGPNSCEILIKCYAIFDALVRTIHGSVEDSLWNLMENTYELNQFNAPPKLLSGGNWPGSEPPYSSISDWVVRNVERGPTVYSAVMIKFAKCALTNSALYTKEQQYAQNMQIIIKYESVLMAVCDVSIMTFLEELACSNLKAHRINAINCISELMCIDVQYNWSEKQETAVNKTPREVAMLRVLMEKIIDKCDNIKKLAIKILTSKFSNGGSKTREIISKVFVENCFIANFEPSSLMVCQYKTPIESVCDIPGIETLQPCLDSLLNNCFYLINTKDCHCQIAVLSFIRDLANLNPRVINDTMLHEQFIKRSITGTITVRTFIIVVLDQWLSVHKKNVSLLALWASILVGHANEKDPKFIKVLSTSFMNNVFNNLKRFENTFNEDDQFPWLLIEHMLLQEPRGIVGKAIQKFLLKDDGIRPSYLVNDTHVSALESHINSRHSNETLVLFHMMSSFQKVRDPETFTQQFLESFLHKMTHYSEQNYLKLEVVVSSIPHLKSPSRMLLLERLESILLTFDTEVGHIGRYYNACSYIRRKETKTDYNNWLESLNKKVEVVFFESVKALFIPNFMDNRIINAMILYSEINTDRVPPPNKTIVEHVLDFLRQAIKNDLRYKMDNVIIKMNASMLLLTRLAIRDIRLCFKITPIMQQIMQKFSNVKILNNLFVALEDLCKRFSTVMEPALKDMMPYCLSDNALLRSRAIECILALLAQDFLKMRGLPYLYLLRVLVSGDKVYMERANNLIVSFKVNKNFLLFHISMWECLFVFNGYPFLRRLDLFADTLITKKLPFVGDDNQALRQAIFRFFVYHLDAITLYMYFEHVHWFYDELEKNVAEIGCAEGMASIKDYLLVCNHIIEYRLPPNKNEDINAAASGVSNVEQNEEAAPISKTEKQDKQKVDEGNAIKHLEKALPVFKKLETKFEIMQSPLQNESKILWKSFEKKFPDLVQYMTPDTGGEVQVSASLRPNLTAKRSTNRGAKKPGGRGR